MKLLLHLANCFSKISLVPFANHLSCDCFQPKETRCQTTGDSHLCKHLSIGNQHVHAHGWRTLTRCFGTLDASPSRYSFTEHFAQSSPTAAASACVAECCGVGKMSSIKYLSIIPLVRAIGDSSSEWSIRVASSCSFAALEASWSCSCHRPPSVSHAAVMLQSVSYAAISHGGTTVASQANSQREVRHHKQTDGRGFTRIPRQRGLNLQMSHFPLRSV